MSPSNCRKCIWCPIFFFFFCCCCCCFFVVVFCFLLVFFFCFLLFFPPQKNRFYFDFETYVVCMKCCFITKTCLYNVDPFKLGFIGVYIIFLIFAQNIDCGYSLEPPRRGGSNEYLQSMFLTKIWKYQGFLSENFQFLEVKFSIYLNRRVFVMCSWPYGTIKTFLMF